MWLYYMRFFLCCIFFLIADGFYTSNATEANAKLEITEIKAQDSNINETFQFEAKSILTNKSYSENGKKKINRTFEFVVEIKDIDRITKKVIENAKFITNCNQLERLYNLAQKLF
jgi:hypothetical protein